MRHTGPVPTLSRPRSGGLGDSFVGTAAGVSGRIAAFTIDAAVALLIGVASWFLKGSIFLTVLMVVETIIALGLMEARTGLTIGNAVLRQRTAQIDRAWSPGAGRQFARSLVVGLGGVVGIVGAWVVVASAAWDRSGRRQSWADRAAGTVVVRVPRQRHRRGRVPAVAPGLQVATAPPPIMAPRAVSTLPPGTTVGPPPEPGTGPVPIAEPRPLAGTAVGSSEPEVTLLLVFDSGQRERIPLGGTGVMGRAPVPTVPTDQVVVVHDAEGTVSKSHLRIEHARDGVWVTDLGSTNGTDLVDDDGHAVRLPAGARRFLDDGVRVRIGHRVFTVSRVVRGG